MHVDPSFSKAKGFQDQVIHGMLAGSFFSTLVGMVCPGEKNLYLTQSLNFRKPIYLGSKLVVRGKIIEKVDSVKLLFLRTEILCGDEIVIEGEARVKLI